MLFICTKKTLHIVTAAATKTKATTTTTGKWDDFFYMKHDFEFDKEKLLQLFWNKLNYIFLFTLFLPEAFYLLFCCWNLELVKRVKTGGALNETFTSENWSGKTALLHLTFFQLTHTHNHFLMLFLSQTNGHHHHLIRMIYYFYVSIAFFLNLQSSPPPYHHHLFLFLFTPYHHHLFNQLTIVLFFN